MLDPNLFSSIRESLATAQSVFIFLPQNPNLDKVAASLGLFLSLKKAGKRVSIACPTEMTVEFSDLVGVDQIRAELGGRDLTISFDYIEDSIEKVSYNIENDKFNLVIQPKTGFPPLSTDKVSYSYSGGGADLLFTIGVRDLRGLGKLYEDLKSVFEKKTVVDIDFGSINKQFAKVSLVDPVASSCSEIMVQLLSRLGLPVDGDIATNLFLGLKRATRNFSSPEAGVATFEAAAFCLRAGARRIRTRGRPGRPSKKKTPLKPMPTEISATKKPEEPPSEEGEEKPPSDWFEPRIYKGDTRV